MENKHVGWLLIGIAIMLAVIVLLFGNNTKTILETTCPLVYGGYDCPAYSALDKQAYIGVAMSGILVIVGVFLIFTRQREKIIIRKIEKRSQRKNHDLSDLTTDEKQVFTLIKEQRAIFQAELIEKSEKSKVAITRILDRLESKGLIERKRRGMNNVVVLKE